MDRERCLAGMDPLDSGLGTKEPKDAKLERAWGPIPLHPEKWVGKVLPEEVVSAHVAESDDSACL